MKNQKLEPYAKAALFSHKLEYPNANLDELKKIVMIPPDLTIRHTPKS